MVAASLPFPLQLALIENLQREDLNPVEETAGILQLLAIQLGRVVESVPTLLYRLQKSQLKARIQVSNNVMGKSESDESELAIESESPSYSEESNPDQPGALAPDFQAIEAGFNGLGLMTWESRVKNRLPLLGCGHKWLVRIGS